MKQSTTLLFIAILTTSFSNQSDAQDCQFGNCDTGYGTQISNGNERYIGEFRDGKKNGYGVFYISENIKYIGNWENGVRQGFGQTFMYKDVIQSGIWKNNTLASKVIKTGCISGDCENGFGSYLYADSRRIYGRFQDGKPTKDVICYYPNGEKYIGEWSDDKKNGIGTTIQDNTMVYGFWKDDTYEGEGRNIKFGCSGGDCKEGLGVFTYRDLTRYEGNFKDGLADGYGVCFFADGEIYAGNWKNHNFEGMGTYYAHNGGVIEGYWKAGVLQKNKPTPNKFFDLTEATVQPKIYALVVGVSTYPLMSNLKYSDDDAYLMYSFLKSPEGGALSDKNIIILIDEVATLDKIKSELRHISDQANSNDVILFYFSGHGIDGAFLPSDYDGNQKVLNHKTILDIVENSAAKSKIIIADACYTGSFESKGNIQYNTEVFYNAFKNTKGGTLLLLSSREKEISIESAALHQGVFSYYLIKGLKGSANRNKDEIITVEELFEYVFANVVSFTRNYQTPIIRGDYDKNMPLGLSND
jgi:hypothetical protein